MSAFIWPKQHQIRSQPSVAAQTDHAQAQLTAAAAAAAAAASAAGLPLVGTAEPELRRRRKSTQGKRSIITHVACQPCQRRKHKCDGERPVCTPCLARKRSDCVYDAAGDQRRTTALKSRIQDLSKQAEDLRDIVRGIAVAPDREAAFATVRELAAADFAQAADVADAFRKGQARGEEASTQPPQELSIHGSNGLALYEAVTSPSCAFPPDEAVPNAVPLDDPGGMSLSPWPFSNHAEPMEFLHSNLGNTPIEFSGTLWQSDDQMGPQFQHMAREAQDIAGTPIADSKHVGQGSELRQSEYSDDSASGGTLQAFNMAPPGPYWCLNPPGP